MQKQLFLGFAWLNDAVALILKYHIIIQSLEI